MKILVIDSHKGTDSPEQSNLHWKNAKIIADALNAKFIWSYPNVNESIESDFDCIVFVHASHYSYTDYDWIKNSPNAKLIYISNETNLGEPRTLWMAIKENRKYDVIANHPPEPSKIVKSYVNKWHIVNLNALIFNPYEEEEKNTLSNFIDFADNERNGIVYYGSFRKDRIDSFKRFLSGELLLSSHIKNEFKFNDCGVTCRMIPRIVWPPKGNGLNDFLGTLYIEDELTRKYYNFLANRFYEGLNYNCVPLFDVKCENTIKKCGYNISNKFLISNGKDVIKKEKLIRDGKLSIPNEWFKKAKEEKEKTIKQIIKICRGK